LAEIEILTNEEAIPENDASPEAKALCLKLILFPEKFTLLELSRLKEIMRAEGYQVD